jgi:hypothetical protein
MIFDNRVRFQQKTHAIKQRTGIWTRILYIRTRILYVQKQRNARLRCLQARKYEPWLQSCEQPCNRCHNLCPSNQDIGGSQRVCLDSSSVLWHPRPSHLCFDRLLSFGICDRDRYCDLALQT